MSEQLTRPPHSRVVIPLTLFIVAAFVALIIAIAPSPPQALARPEPIVDAAAVESLMRRIGATAETLAAAGLTSNQAGVVVGYLDTFLTSNLSNLIAADNAVASAKSTVAALERKARSGMASGEDLTALATARTTLSTANTSLATLLGEARDAAYADLSDPQKAVLAAIQSACHHGDLGVPICAASFDEAEWTALHRAAGALRAAAFTGEDPDPEAEELLDDAAGEAEAIAAQANIDVRLDGVTAAIATALAGV